MVYQYLGEQLKNPIYMSEHNLICVRENDDEFNLDWLKFVVINDELLEWTTNDNSQYLLD